MRINTDSSSVFLFLEKHYSLPRDYSSSSSYWFTLENDFFLVIYLNSAGERNFELYQVESHISNKHELTELQLLLQEKRGNGIYLEAAGLVQDFLSSLSAQGSFFDAH